MRTLWWSRRKKDFRIDWYSGSGAGGQYRNRHRNCCRMTDIETGIMTTGQESRSRKQNLKAAFRRMVKKLVEYYKNLTKSPDLCTKSSKGIKSTFGARCTRTYHEVDDRVVDHITGKKYSYRHTVGEGDMSQIIEDRIASQKYLDIDISDDL